MINENTVIRQCLSLLPTEKLSCPLLNYDMKKLTTEALIKIFVAAQLDKWESYSSIEVKLGANKDLMEYLGLNSISGSQLSRRINDLDTSILQSLFLTLVNQYENQTNRCAGISPKIGRLRIVDSTQIKLPAILSDWAYVSKGLTAVKMHTRLIVASPDVIYPDKIVPSNGKVQDYAGGDLLIEVSDATYVADRGYMDFYRMNEWIKNQIKFVIRLRNTQIVIRTLEEYEVPPGTSILRDAKVILGENGKMNPVRIIEFLDEEGKPYRIATNRWDLEASEVAEIYKHRWLIELFFKWIKQSLRFVKVWSTKPQGIWNQMFIAVIAYILMLILKQRLNSTKTNKVFLDHIRSYIQKSWTDFIDALKRVPTKTSKGRQKVPEKPKVIKFGSVALMNKENSKRIKRKIR